MYDFMKEVKKLLKNQPNHNFQEGNVNYYIASYMFGFLKAIILSSWIF